MSYKTLLFDLDGTLLRSDCSISFRTLEALRKCREKGLLLGIATARSEMNARSLIPGLSPDVVVSSGGAFAAFKGMCVCRTEFTLEETHAMIRRAKNLCGPDCRLLVDTVDGDYCSYENGDASWSTSIFTDFRRFSKRALRVCARLPGPDAASALAQGTEDCGWVKFSHGDWYQFTKNSVSKDRALLRLCREAGLSVGDVIAFGDDLTDIGMLACCGKGVAMGNAVDEVKRAADVVIGDHDQDGIADYLSEILL